MTRQQSTSRPSLDDAIAVLADQYRRRLLVALLEQEPEAPLRVGDAVGTVANRETVTTRLQHAHLPKLADSGYIVWDREGHTIWRGPHFEDVQPLLAFIADHPDRLPDNAH